MKKLALIFALGAFTFTGVKAMPLSSPVQTQIVQDNRVEIAPEDLPQEVKETILEDEEIRTLPISEAFKVTDLEGTVTYEVTFGMEEEAIVKKYDENGNEITDL